MSSSRNKKVSILSQKLASKSHLCQTTSIPKKVQVTSLSLVVKTGLGTRATIPTQFLSTKKFERRKLVDTMVFPEQPRWVWVHFFFFVLCFSCYCFRVSEFWLQSKMAEQATAGQDASLCTNSEKSFNILSVRSLHKNNLSLCTLCLQHSKPKIIWFVFYIKKKLKNIHPSVLQFL